MCGPPSARTILLVDDTFALLKLLTALLEGAGFDVLAANCASEALRMCRQKKIDLLLTDVSMPDLTGPQLAMRVANFAPDAPVLYMSGSDGESLQVMGFSWIEARLLRKPFSPADLLNAVDGILDGDLSPAPEKTWTPPPQRQMDVPRQADQSPVGAKRTVLRPHCPKSAKAVGI